MKKIEKPFAESAITRLTKAETAYELAYKRYCDLKFLREKVAAGKLTPELYDFINTDGSLENLLQSLPRPTDVTCEALTDSQLMLIDATIAEEGANLKAIVDAIWEAIKDWWMDWWERNRWEKKLLDGQLGLWHNNPGAFGDDTTFSATNVLMYSHTDWEILAHACRNLKPVCDELAHAGSNLKSVMEKAKVSASEPLKAFGKYINENDVVCQGQPNYTRRENTCANLRWRFVEIEKYIQVAKSVLEDDIAIRKQFNELERTFKSVDPTDRAALMFAKRILFASKEMSLHVGRTLRVMLNKILRDRAAMQSMLHH